jgi:hypothetical protein
LFWFSLFAPLPQAQFRSEVENFMQLSISPGQKTWNLLEIPNKVLQKPYVNKKTGVKQRFTSEDDPPKRPPAASLDSSSSSSSSTTQCNKNVR